MLALAAVLALAPLHMRSVDELGCQLVATADPSLQDRWEYVEADQFQVHQTPSVFRGQGFLFACFFTGYARDAQGNADLTYVLRITRPDGKVYHESADHAGWKRAANASLPVLLGEELVGCSFDPPDPLGTYTATVRVTDGVSGATAEATTTIELVEYVEGAGFDDADALEQWIGGYNGDPEPQRAVPALWAYCREHGFTDASEAPWRDGFFVEVFATNPWLFAHAFEGLKKRSAEEQRGALWLLAHSSAESGAFVKKLTKDQKALWAEVSGAVHDPLEEPLEGPHDLDELMGRYFAYGRLAPLERLIRGLHADGAVISEGTVHSDERDIDVPLVRVVPKVVAKRLASRFESDRLARGYAHGLLLREKLPAGVAGELETLLAAAEKR